MQNFLSKINAKLILIHFAALWLLVYALRTLAFLYDFTFLIVSPEVARMNEVARTNLDLKIVALAASLAAVAGYIISWRISLKNKWYWVNSTIAFAIVYVLQLYNLLGWRALQKIFLYPGRIFSLDGRAFYIVNGCIMLALGLFLLFSKRIQRFIDGKKAVANKAGTSRAAKVK